MFMGYFFSICKFCYCARVLVMWCSLVTNTTWTPSTFFGINYLFVNVSQTILHLATSYPSTDILHPMWHKQHPHRRRAFENRLLRLSWTRPELIRKCDLPTEDEKSSETWISANATTLLWWSGEDELKWLNGTCWGESRVANSAESPDKCVDKRIKLFLQSVCKSSCFSQILPRSPSLGSWGYFHSFFPFLFLSLQH